MAAHRRHASRLAGLIAGRQPHNPIGWLFLFISSDTGLTALADAYAGHHLPCWAAAAWLQTWSSYLSYPVGFSLLLMLFPSGRLPSRRWRPLLGLAVFAAASRVAVELVAGGPISGHFSATALLGANPAGLIPVSVENGAGGRAVYVGTWLFSLAAEAGPPAAVLTRLVRSRSEERQQLKWLGLIAVMTVAAFAGHFVIPAATGGPLLDFGSVVFHALLVLGIPAATAIATLRYRPYHLDVLIHRTPAYGLLTIIVVGFHVGAARSLG